MKTVKNLTSIFVLCSGALLFTACGEKAENAAREEVEQIIDEISEELEGCDPLRDEKISIGAVHVMRESYKYTLQNWLYPDVHGVETPVLYRQLPVNDITELMSQVENCDGVRVYFAYPDAETRIPESPKLVLIPTVGCDAAPDIQNVLVTTNEPNRGEFIPLEDAGRLTENWRNALNNHEQKQRDEGVAGGWVYNRIYAYTFKKDNFDPQEYVNNGNLVRFDYTMRVKENENQVFAGFYGTLQIGLVLPKFPAMEVLTYKNVDFALPCPKSCGRSNPLYPQP